MDLIHRGLTETKGVPQSFDRNVYSDLVPVLEAISHRLRRAMNLDSHAVDLLRLDSVHKVRTGEPHDPQRRRQNRRLMCFEIDGHPDLVRVLCGQALKPQDRQQANHTSRNELGGGSKTVVFGHACFGKRVHPASRTSEQTLAVAAHQRLPRHPKLHNFALTPNGAILADRMVNELQAVVAELGGETTLGRALRTTNDLQSAIREGFPQMVVGSVMNSSGLTLRQLSATLDLSPRSLQRRRHSGRLARYESDRIYRLARIVALAKQYIGDEDTATRWLKRPNRALGGQVPLELIDTELGARAVENALGRIAYGGVS